VRSAAHPPRPRRHLPRQLRQQQAPELVPEAAFGYVTQLEVSDMAKLIVSGAAGRMGRLLISMIAADPRHTLVGALEAEQASVTGRDAGELAGAGKLGVAITTDYATIAHADTVTLDFTNAAASVSHLEVAAAKGAAIVVGSTGFTPELDARARQLAPQTRTLIAPNMSAGINVLMKITAEVAAMLADFDTEVLEIHHRTKVDAPSGTAIALARTIAEARKLEFQPNAVFGREGITGVRPHETIGVMALRAGDAVGDHTVIFGGQGERLELIHRSQSRESLARGALRAAVWLEPQKPGLYSMRDVLGL
jgi:4-hydroxy-tetrahydrodipicolinate reductase